MKPPRPWDNYIMRKFGQSIRDNIEKALVGGMVRACVASKLAAEIEPDKLVKNEPVLH